MKVLKLLCDKLIEFDDTYRDRRIDEVPFFNSPLQIAAVVALYYTFVTRWGPKLMKNRPAFEMRNFMLFYNVLQVVANFIFTLISVWYLLIVKPFKTLTCVVPLTADHPLSNVEVRLSLFYVISKFVDYFDTVVFVLRKRQRQVSFLHVYHHMLMSVFSCIYLRYLPGGHIGICAVGNGFVHVIMYAYYLATALRPKADYLMRWKKHMTQLQIIQFLIMLTHCSVPLIKGNCAYPKVALIFAVLQAGIMVYLFSDFYYKTYWIKPTQQQNVSGTTNKEKVT